MQKRLALFAVIISLGPLAPAQAETESATLFWRSCMLTDSYKKLAEKANESSASDQQCRAERDGLRAQRDTTAEDLKRARSDLEAVRAELATARQQVESSNTQLKKALGFHAMSFGYFKSSRASECAVTTQNFLRNMSEFTDVQKQTWGATAQSSTCGATVWCSGAADKDGDLYLLWAVSCTDGRAASIRSQMGELPKQLR